MSEELVQLQRQQPDFTGTQGIIAPENILCLHAAENRAIVYGNTFGYCESEFGCGLGFVHVGLDLCTERRRFHVFFEETGCSIAAGQFIAIRMFVTGDCADVAMHLARGSLRLTDNHGFAGSRRIHIVDHGASAEGARHRRFYEATALCAFELGWQKGEIVTVAPEFGADQIEILTWTRFAFIAVDRPERPAKCGTRGGIRVIIVFCNTTLGRIIGILG